MPRGRQRKADAQEANPSIEAPAPKAAEELAEEKQKLQAEDKKRKEENPVMDKWYELRGNKVVLVRKTKSGSKYRSYYCHAKKQRAEVEKLKKKGLLRVEV